MSTIFFIGPFNPEHWSNENDPARLESPLRIDPSAYRNALLKRWPTAKEWESEHFANGVYWSLDEYNLHGIEVHLHNGLQQVSMTPHGINFVEFVLWHRAYVSDEHTLFLYNTSDLKSFELTPTTTADDVIEFTGFRDTGLKKESPLNGTWDGSLLVSDPNDSMNYRCTLHLFDYGHELQAEMLLSKYPNGEGAVYTELRGTCSSERNQLELDRVKILDTIGEGLESNLESFQSLKLHFENSIPPRLHGVCVTTDRETLGEIQIARRGLYDPPPPI
jgi:hypothetical protein